MLGEDGGQQVSGALHTFRIQQGPNSQLALYLGSISSMKEFFFSNSLFNSRTFSLMKSTKQNVFLDLVLSNISCFNVSSIPGLNDEDMFYVILTQQNIFLGV